MRPIDSDKFLQDMADLYRQAGWDEREVHFSLADLRSNIGTEDTIMIPQREPDTVPVRHGKWIECHDDSDWIVCSECGKPFNIIDNCTEEFNYCPNCGAMMDEE